MAQQSASGQPTTEGPTCHKCGGRLLRGRSNCLHCGAPVPGGASKQDGASGGSNMVLIVAVLFLVFVIGAFVLLSKMDDGPKLGEEIVVEGSTGGGGDSISVSMRCVSESDTDEINKLLDEGYREEEAQGGQRCFVREN